MKERSKLTEIVKTLLKRHELRWLFIAGAMSACLSSDAFAESKCSGVLDAHLADFQRFFTPEYSAKLIINGPRVDEGYQFKQLSKDDAARLEDKKPLLVAHETLKANQAAALKQWLNDNTATVPGYIATATSILIPEAWFTVSIDIAIQLINGSGDRRVLVANLAGTVSEGGKIAVTEQVVKDGSGKIKFVWAYLYEAKLNEKTVVTRLERCSADTIIK